MQRLAQKVALVTGGASGLGKAIAQRLASDGASVVITDVDRSAGTATAAAAGLTFMEQDVCDEPRWTQVVTEIEQRLGRLNILVNNAGILGPMTAASPEDTPLDLWRRIFAVNVEGVFLGCRAAIPAMRRAGDGSIINISSIAGLRASPYATAYGASKAAVRHLTKSVAQHCAERKLNIRCNSVHPGDVRTPLWDKAAEELALARQVPVEAIIEEGRTDSPMGEFTLPEDIAAMVAFLASDEARHITGTKMVVDGGTVNCESYRKPVRGASGPSR
jgi:NAD(P)-dependent dehydrogenase (short-subunit alcohol dehydrogenase family)